MHYLIIPGLNNSGPTHWQSFWAKSLGNATRVVQHNWDAPQKAEWVKTLDEAISKLESDTILVAHSLGVSTTVHWLTELFEKNPKAHFVKGAFLVSASDVDNVEIIKNFAPMPLKKLPIPAWVLASENDPFVTMDRSKFFAEAWNAHVENVGLLGHINAQSNLGEWEQGRKILAEFEKTL